MRNEVIGLASFADDKGDELTWNVLTDYTQKIVACSAVKSAIHSSPNWRIAPPQGERQTPDLNLETFVYGGTNSTGAKVHVYPQF